MFECGVEHPACAPPSPAGGAHSPRTSSSRAACAAPHGVEQLSLLRPATHDGADPPPRAGASERP
eukprot:6765582-Prymnesium_polylepis.1